MEPYSNLKGTPKKAGLCEGLGFVGLGGFMGFRALGFKALVRFTF